MDSTENNYRKHGMGEGNPGNINPDEIGMTPPDKNISESEHLDRKESDLGVTQSYKSPEEFVDEPVSQIDAESGYNRQSDSMKQTIEKEFDTTDFNRVDERDPGDSTDHWDAEKSRTGRQK